MSPLAPTIVASPRLAYEAPARPLTLHAEPVEAQGPTHPGAPWVRARIRPLLDALAALWMVCGAVVVTEPSPYELMFFTVLGTSLVAGLRFRRATLGLLVLFCAFVPFALIAAFQVRFSTVADALTYQAVTIFLFFTSYWVANYVAEVPQQRVRLLLAAYLAAALVSAVLGTLGYLGVAHDLLTRYDRAKALFNDPNVYGPFLILPAMFALQRALVDAPRRALFGALAYGVLLVGVFASFSRAAWGHIAISSLIVYALVFAFEANGRQKARMLMLAVAFFGFLVIAGLGLFSVDSFRSFIEQRTQEQTYDTGETGRFGRQGYAFALALEHPLGLGPLEFRNLRVKEEPHDTYVNVLHAYGWGGGLAFILFIAVTAWRGVSFVVRPGPNRLLLIPLVSVFVPLAGEAAIIDIDHWRHFFLVAGLIWGVTAAYQLRDARFAVASRVP